MEFALRVPFVSWKDERRNRQMPKALIVIIPLFRDVLTVGVKRSLIAPKQN